MCSSDLDCTHHVAAAVGAAEAVAVAAAGTAAAAGGGAVALAVAVLADGDVAAEPLGGALGRRVRAVLLDEALQQTSDKPSANTPLIYIYYL